MTRAVLVLAVALLAGCEGKPSEYQAALQQGGKK